MRGMETYSLLPLVTCTILTMALASEDDNTNMSHQSTWPIQFPRGFIRETTLTFPRPRSPATEFSTLSPTPTPGVRSLSVNTRRVTTVSTFPPAPSSATATAQPSPDLNAITTLLACILAVVSAILGLLLGRLVAKFTKSLTSAPTTAYAKMADQPV